MWRKCDYIKCINVDGLKWSYLRAGSSEFRQGLTVGNVYKVLYDCDVNSFFKNCSNSNDLVWIKNDEGEDTPYFSSRFILNIGRTRKEKLKKIKL